MELRDPRAAQVIVVDDRPFAERARDALIGSEAVPAAVAPPTGHARFPLVDGVRAVAALAVVVTHAGFSASSSPDTWYLRLTARLDVGVAIFFAVAGFLLFRPYLAEHVDGLRAPTFQRYLFRRGLRVLPAYWVALTVLALAGLVVLDSRAWEQYGLVQIYDHQELFGGIVPAWSLATEVTFYLALPVLVTWVRSTRAQTRTGRLRSAAFLVASLWIAALGFRIALRTSNGGHPSLWFNALPGTLDWFALGMGLAVLSVAFADGGKRPGIVTFLEEHPEASWVAAVIVFVAMSFGIDTASLWGEPRTLASWATMHALYGAVAVLVLAPAVFVGKAKAPLHQLLAHPLVGALGVISYGVFLYNGPFAVWLSRSQLSGMWAGKPFLGILLATLVLTIPAAALSYRLVERPLLSLKDWRPALPARLLAGARAGVDRRAG